MQSGNSHPNSGAQKLEARLGEALHRAGWLTQAQLTQAIQERTDNPLMIGEICLEHGWITPGHLYRMLPISLVRLGEILILNGHLTYERLRITLTMQKQRPQRRLGELLILDGWLTPEQLAWGLEEQAYLRSLRVSSAWESLRQRIPNALAESWDADLVESPDQLETLQAQSLPSDYAELLADLEQVRGECHSLQLLNHQLTQNQLRDQQRIQQLETELNEVRRQLAALSSLT